MKEEDAEERVRWKRMICCGAPGGSSEKTKKKRVEKTWLLS